MLLIVALRRLLCRSRGRLVHIVPASVVVGLPTRPRVLVDIAVVTGVHVAVGGLSRSRIAISCAGSRTFAARRGLDSSRRTIGVAGVLGVSRVAVLANHGLSP